MASPQNFNEQQFGNYRLRYDPDENNSVARALGGGPDNLKPRYHSVVARDQSGAEVGGLVWGRYGTSDIPGKIAYIHVEPEHQRNGLATAMYQHALDSGITPSPQHSPERSDAGEAWAKHVGGEMPPRRTG